MLQKGFTHILLIFVIIFVGVGYLIIKSGSIKFAEKPLFNSNLNATTTPLLQISENESEVTLNMDLTHIYKNNLGFSILYPKSVKNYTSCEARKSGKPMGTLAMKLFEEPNLNQIYLVEESTLEFQSIQGGTFEETCRDITYNLELIKKSLQTHYDYRNRDTQTIRYYSTPIEIKYKRINFDSDLVTLAQSMFYYRNCSQFSKVPLKDNPDIYKINLTQDSIENDDTAEEIDKKCITNFAYQFLYSPENKVAVITSGRQEAYFMGTNNQYMPIIKFEGQ